MTDVESFRIHDTCFMVSTVESPPPADKRVSSWGPGFRSPDWQTFNRLLRVLRARGFSVGRDPWHEKSFKSLSKFHRLASVATPHGVLYAHCAAEPNGCKFEFFQEVVTENRNGGRFDFDKRARMPYLIRKKFEGAVAAMEALLLARGFGRTVAVETPVRAMPIGHRLAVVEGRAAPLSDAEIDAAARAFFDDKWDGEYDRKRGTHRFRRGGDGWPTEDELGAYNRKDRDKNVIAQGAIRLFRDQDGYLRRGRVSGGIGGQWTVVFGPNERDVTHRSSFELFSGDPRSMRRRDKKAKPLARVLEEAVARQDFERAIVLRDLIAKEKARKDAENVAAKVAEAA